MDREYTKILRLRERYKEILRLRAMLLNAKITHRIKPYLDGYHMIVFLGKTTVHVMEHGYSYGHEEENSHG
jgi:hypothetical protein